MMRWVRAASVLVLCSSVAGFGTCRRESGGEKTETKKGGNELPTGATSVPDPTANVHPPLTPPWAPNGASGTPSSFAPLAKVAGAAVVTIVIKVKRKSGRPTMKGLGSGFLIDKEGTILTNNHVVAGGNAIEVVLANDKAIEGKVLGTDPTTDVAVVKIEPPVPAIEPIPLGDSDGILVGDWVVAIGNPLGLSHTVTAGILSARGRTTKDVPLKAMGGGEAYFDFLQTDAAINPGNSGGPLLNLKGEAIGINTAINAAGQGLAFAIPINMVKQMLPSLVKEGRVVRSYLGVGIEDAPMDEKTGLRGAVVMRIMKGGPADKAALKIEDRVVAVDGTPVRDSSHMRWLVSIAGVGKKVTLRVLRDNKAFDLPVKLDKLPEKKPVPEPGDDDDDEDETSLPPGHPGHH